MCSNRVDGMENCHRSTEAKPYAAARQCFAKKAGWCGMARRERFHGAYGTGRCDAMRTGVLSLPGQHSTPYAWIPLWDEHLAPVNAFVTGKTPSHL